MAVREISQEAVTIPEEEEITEAARILDRESIGAMVVEKDDTVSGILTDREIALSVTDHNGDLSGVTVRDVMTEDTHTLQADDDSMKAAHEMAEAGVRRMPVIDDTGSPVGLVSLDDVIALAGEQLEDAATVIEKQSSGYEP